MNQTLFLQYVLSFMPVLKTLIEKINGKRGNQLTYLHKDTNILRRVFSPDNKWEADTVNLTYVAADFVAVDSPLPVKARDTIGQAGGKLPKIGIKRFLKESDINQLNAMDAQGGMTQEIRRRLAQDPIFCATGIDEQNEYAFLFGLSNGYVAVKDEDNPDALLRINFGYLDKNKFGIQEADKGLTVDDLKYMKEKADEHGDTIIEFWMAKSTYDKLRKTDSAKVLVANYNGQVYTSISNLSSPTANRFNEAFTEETGATIRVIDRSVVKEKNGVRTSVKPWNANMVIGVCNAMIGALVYGRLAEQTNPVPGVQYTTIDTYKLIAKFSKTDPLLEATTGQAYSLPVIENADQVYQLDVTKVQEVDENAEAADTTDQYITVWGNKYVKSTFITELNKFGAGIKANASDAQVIKAVNKLNDEETAKLKVAVQGAIVN
jgi:hypothetical protein